MYVLRSATKKKEQQLKCIVKTPTKHYCIFFLFHKIISDTFFPFSDGPPWNRVYVLPVKQVHDQKGNE